MLKKMMIIGLSLLSFNVFAETVDICKASNGIRVLYFGQKDFNGINSYVLENKRVINNEEKIFLDKYFEITPKNNNLYISSVNLNFNDCIKISNLCENYRNVEHYNYSGICTPLGSKINLIIN